YAMGIANLGRTWTKPGSWYRNITTILGGQRQINYHGDVTQQQVHAYFSEQTPQFWNISTFYIARPSVIDDKGLRGGPAIRVPTYQFAELDMSTDSRAKLIGDWGGSRGWNTRGGSDLNVYADARYRPAPNLSLSFGPSFYSGRTYAQYVTSV